MQKPRKTKKEKIRSSQRSKQTAFEVKEDWLKTKTKRLNHPAKSLIQAQNISERT